MKLKAKVEMINMQNLTRSSSCGCSPQDKCPLKPNDVSAVYNWTDYRNSESIRIKKTISNNDEYTPPFYDIKVPITTSSFSQIISRQQQESISLLSTDEITITPVKELSYNDAKREIIEYIHNNGNRRVYVSEIAENLVIDFDLIEDILKDVKKDTHQYAYV